MNFTSEVVIGLEVHVQLNTATKLFCSCPTQGSEEANSRCCPVCLGHPGARPVINQKALEYASKFCLAVNSKLASKVIFSRKSYFYPDMSKNFQITQFEEPLGLEGSVHLKSGREVSLIRVHMEEDPAAISYPLAMRQSSYCLIDYNRSGNPLIEIVTKPELTSPEEARDFLNQLISIIAYLKIFDLNHGIIKADANVSIKETNYTRVEIKNITGFKELEKALGSEINRQKQLAAEGKKLVQETRGWDNQTNFTYPLRLKETEADYGYIIEPDLPIVELGRDWLQQLKSQLPELAYQKSHRYTKNFKLDPADAEVMSMDLDLAQLFETVAQKIDPPLAAKWMRKELLRVLNFHKKTAADIKFSPEQLIELLQLVAANSISDDTAQKIIEELMIKPFSPKQYVEQHHLQQISDNSELQRFCIKVIDENQAAVADYKSGSEKSLNFLIGQVMKLSRGKASPQLVSDIMKQLIK